MFVDSVAMRKWLIANPSAYTEQYKELLPKITARLASVGNLTTSSGATTRIEIIELTATDEQLVSERDEQPTAFGVDGTAIAIFLRTSALPASA